MAASLFSIVSTTRRTAMRWYATPDNKANIGGLPAAEFSRRLLRLPSWRFGRRILTVSHTPRPGASRAATLMRIPYARCSPSLPMRLQTYSLRLGLRPACSSTTSSKRISAITATSESIKRFSVTRPSRGVRTITAPTCAKCSPGPSTAPLPAPSGLPSPLASERNRPPFGTYAPLTRCGSAFVVTADGYVVTNSHVLGGERQALIGTHDGREEYAPVVADDPDIDLAC